MSQDVVPDEAPDEASVWARVGGDNAFVRLVDTFYAKVAEDAPLRGEYPEDLGPGKAHLAGFLAQYWGGPRRYSEERGHPRLRMRHARFDITPELALRWATHMVAAVREQGWPDDVEDEVVEYVVHATPQLVNRAPDAAHANPNLPVAADIVVRGATPADMPEVAEIYDHYVHETTITFDVVGKTVDEWVVVLAETHQVGHHFVVATVGTDVVGYARTMQFRPKAGYVTTAETSIYVAPEHAGQGVGAALYTELFERLATSGTFNRAVAGVALPSPASVALHERFGFVAVGTFTEVGRKFDRFVDVTFFQREL